MEKTEKNTIIDFIKTPFEFSLLIKYSKMGVLKIDFLKEMEEKINNHNFSYVTYQIIRYINGEKIYFKDVPLIIDNFRDFGLKTLKICRQIPYGTVITYKELAKKAGNERAYRAVGNILGKNPIPILIPCHRVIGSDGKLHGFTGGIDIKKTLLNLEKAI